jgi:acetamidase/formamidase
MFTPSRGHCLAGQIEVRGAEPGQVLAVHIDWTALNAFHLSEVIRSATA